MPTAIHFCGFTYFLNCNRSFCGLVFPQVPIDVFKGITDEDAAKVVDGLAPKAADRNDSIEQVKKLYELFCKCDCTLLEVRIFCNIFKLLHNPFVAINIQYLKYQERTR